jgi:HEAT repeat protein
MLLVTLSAPVLPPTETVDAEPIIKGKPLHIWTDQLRGEDVAKRWQAVGALELAGRDAVPVLIAALKDEDSIIVRRVQNALRQIGEPAFAGVLAALKDDDPDARRRALAALPWVSRHSDKAIGPAVLLLADKEAKVRACAADVLAELATEGHVVVGPLLSALHNPEAEVRAAAALALGRLRIEAGVVRPSLIAALHDPASIVRAAAADSLAEVGIEAADAETVNSLIVAMTTDHAAAVRLGAVRVLARTDLSGRPLAQVLDSLLHDPDCRVRSAAVCHLSHFDPWLAERELALLVESLHDESSLVRGTAGMVLVLSGEEGVPPMCLALKDSEAKVRMLAANILGLQKAAAATGPLAAALTDPEPGVRLTAAEALSVIGPDAAAAIPALKAAMKDKNPAVRQAAEAALAHIDPSPDKAGGKP